MKAVALSMQLLLSLCLLAGCGSCTRRGAGPAVIESFSGGGAGDVRSWTALPALPA